MSRDELEDWLLDVNERMDRLTGPRVARRMGWEPKIDLLESPDEVIIRAELAGVAADGLRVLYMPERNSVVLRGRRSDALQHRSDQGLTAHHLEIDYGLFEREIGLPDVEIDQGGIRSHFHNGMLIVALPKVSKDGRQRLAVDTIVLRKR